MNYAAESGPSTFKWWKDWRGECVAIVASGPSTRKEDVEALCDRIHVVAIKRNVEICPWADVVYGCDEPWWRHSRGLPDFKGLKLSYADKACARFPDIRKINIDKKLDRILVDSPGIVGSGGNSGFQALNIVVQFGASAVLLIGFDMCESNSKPHWYGRNTATGMSNPGEHNYRKWRAAFEGSAEIIRTLGIDVVNVSAISALKCFRRGTVDQALRGWGL